MKKMIVDPHSEHSALPERISKHAFPADLCRELWRQGEYEMAVLRAEADTAGYHLVVTVQGIARHIQLKAATAEGRTSQWKIAERLMDKLNSCLVFLFVRRDTHLTEEYALFGAAPDAKLLNITNAQKAKPLKGKAIGVQSDGKWHRKIGISKFKKFDNISELADRLFGTQALGRKIRPCLPKMMIPSSSTTTNGHSTAIAMVPPLPIYSLRSSQDCGRHPR